MSRTYDYSDADTDVRVMLSLVTDEYVDDDAVDYFIEKADNYIDSRLAKRYSVPFTQSTTPPIITDISANLASYYVLKRLKMETRPTETDYARTFFNDAMQTLTAVNNGKVEILDSDGNIIQPRSDTGIVSSTSDYKPVFNEGDETDWAVDPDKNSDEADKY